MHLTLAIGDRVRHNGKGLMESNKRYAASHTAGTVTRVGRRITVQWDGGALKIHKSECLEPIPETEMVK